MNEVNEMNFAVLLLVARLQHAVAKVETTSQPPAKVGSSNDLFGVSFIYPHPICTVGTYYKLQMVPRGFDPVRAEVVDPLQINPSGEALRYADIRSGKSTTIYLSCHFYRGDDACPNATNSRLGGTICFKPGSVMVTATADILLHVLYDYDSYTVFPLEVLRLDYTVLSVDQNLASASFFVVVCFASNKQTLLTMQTLDGRNQSVTGHQDVILHMMSKDSLTGLTLQASQPIFVVSGCVDRESGRVLQESVVPDCCLGTHYILHVPFNPVQAQILVAAYSKFNMGSVQLRVTGDRVVVPMALDTNGRTLNVSQVVGGSKREVTVSGARPFAVLFVLHSSAVLGKYTGKEESFHLHSLVSVAPVQQYVTDPCYYFQRNTLRNMTFVAGVMARPDALQAVLGRDRWQWGGGWVGVVDGKESCLVGTAIAALQQEPVPLWFHDVTIMRRHHHVYFLDGVSNMLAINDPCRQTSTTLDDGVDNDCDGLFDEETKNGKDDDGDGRVDEDVSTPVDINCGVEPRNHYLWEPFRYRMTRFEPNVYEFARRIPDHNEEMVIISAVVGVSLVFLFIFVVWVVDAIKNAHSPQGPPWIF